MKAFQFVDWRKPAELREVPVPDPGPGQILVKVGGAGACHSDLHMLEMEKPALEARAYKIPFTLGHENAGWVEKLGPGAAGFARGDSVIVYGPWGERAVHELSDGYGELLSGARRSKAGRPGLIRRRNGTISPCPGDAIPGSSGNS